ncbi:MAG: hypothetical protein JO370_09075 [Paucibacter sp.]|nr:hypothetical protein [Roseateles sp.]
MGTIVTGASVPFKMEWLDAHPVYVLAVIDPNEGLLFAAVEHDPTTTSIREALWSLDVIDGEVELAETKWSLNGSAPDIEFEAVHPACMVASFG